MSAKFAEPREPLASAQPALFPGSVAALALAAGIAELVLHRGALQVISTLAHRDVVTIVEVVARFVRNLSAVLLAVGIVIATRRAMRSPNVGFGGGRRVLLGLLSGVLFPVLGIATAMPDSRTTILVVLLGILAGYSTAVVYGFTAFDRDATIEQRTASAFLLLFSAASLTGFVGQIASGIAELALGPSTLHVIRACIELAYFGLPVGLGLAEIAGRAKPTALAYAVAVLAGAITFAGIVALDRALPADFDLLLYGSLRLAALESSSPLVYATLFGLAAAGTTLAVATESRRHLGFGAAFVLLAGAGAGSPFAIANVVFAATAIGLVAARRADDGVAPVIANHRVGESNSHVVS